MSRKKIHPISRVISKKADEEEDDEINSIIIYNLCIYIYNILYVTECLKAKS